MSNPVSVQEHLRQRVQVERIPYLEGAGVRDGVPRLVRSDSRAGVCD